MYICICAEINEKKLRDLIAQGFDTVEDLALECGISAQCGACLLEVEEELRKAGKSG